MGSNASILLRKEDIEQIEKETGNLNQVIYLENFF